MKLRLGGLGAISIVLLLAAIMAIGSMVWLRARVTQGPPLGLTLLVNHRSHLGMTAGTPLFFEASLTSSPSSGPITIGSRWRAWHRLIRLEASAREGMPWTLSAAGPPRSLSVRRTAEDRPEIRREEASAVAHLKAGLQVHTVTVVASPEATAGVRPGAYRVRAVLETPWWMVWTWRGRKVSQAVTIVVRDASKPGETRDALEKQRLTRAADFYLGFRQFGEAEKAARQLVVAEPRHAEAHVLLGDAMAGLRRWDEALAAYRRAMVLLPPSYEEPTLLMNRIQLAVEGRRR